MFDVMSLPLDWPVEVNYHEAKAFCSWKGPTYRLPTEAEHHRIRDHPVRTHNICKIAENQFLHRCIIIVPSVKMSDALYIHVYLHSSRC